VAATVVGARARVAVNVGCTGADVGLATGGVAEGPINVGLFVSGTGDGRAVSVEGGGGCGAAQAVSVRAIITKIFRAFMVSSPVSWNVLGVFNGNPGNKIAARIWTTM